VASSFSTFGDTRRDMLIVIVIVIDYTQHWPLPGHCVPKIIPIHASYVSSPPDPEHIDHTEMSLQLFA
jgi:hypothetical protein